MNEEAQLPVGDDQEAQEAFRENEHIQQRRLHRDILRAAGVDPYGRRFERTHMVGPVLEAHRDLAVEGQGETVRIAGRLTALREHGKAAFGDLTDLSGKIQIYFKKDELGDQRYGLLKALDVGDVLGVAGDVFRTRRGEITVLVRDFTFLTKAVRPMPEKWHGLKDVERRYRERYVDLLANKDVRDTFVLRARIVAAIRNFLDGKGFIEIDTPTMLPLAGGATARPFVTHHNALDLTLFLRIATELYLKRCIVGGLEKVYELGRIFRNEGISTRHNPEFSMLELYEAYSDYEGMMRMTEDIISHVCRTVLGTHQIPFGDQTIDLQPPYTRLTMTEGLKRYGDIDLAALRDLPFASETARRLGIPVDRKADVGHLMEKIFDAVVGPHLVQPTFVLDYPIELSPLARRRDDDPDLTYRFELFVCESEIANAFSELNDPDDQRQRFTGQALLREKGDEEAHPIDEDFVRALEYGMPPTGGLGMGIDRLIMLLSNHTSIRDVIVFPLMRPR